MKVLKLNYALFFSVFVTLCSGNTSAANSIPKNTIGVKGGCNTIVEINDENRATDDQEIFDDITDELKDNLNNNDYTIKDDSVADFVAKIGIDYKTVEKQNNKGDDYVEANCNISLTLSSQVKGITIIDGKADNSVDGNPLIKLSRISEVSTDKKGLAKKACLKALKDMTENYVKCQKK